MRQKYKNIRFKQDFSTFFSFKSIFIVAVTDEAEQM